RAARAGADRDGGDARARHRRALPAHGAHRRRPGGVRHDHAPAGGDRMRGVFAEVLRAAVASLMAHRMRSFLTTLGILIGTASVIAVVSLVQGMSASITDQFSDLGGNTMTLQAVNDNENFRTGSLNFISFDDVDVLRYKVPGIDQVAP